MSTRLPTHLSARVAMTNVKGGQQALIGIQMKHPLCPYMLGRGSVTLKVPDVQTHAVNHTVTATERKCQLTSAYTPFAWLTTAGSGGGVAFGAFTCDVTPAPMVSRLYELSGAMAFEPCIVPHLDMPFRIDMSYSR